MALVIARSLAERGVEVIGCDDVGLTVLSFSRHVKETFTVAPWDKEPEQFLQDMEAAVLEYAPRDGRPYVLMPVFREIDLLSRNRTRFEPAIKLAAPRIESIELVTPKNRLATLAVSAKLNTPRTWQPEIRRGAGQTSAEADLSGDRQAHRRRWRARRLVRR